MRKAEAVKAWQAAGLMAWKSLESEIIAHTEATGKMPMPNADPNLGSGFFREVKRSNDPVGHIWTLTVTGLNQNPSYDALNKRLAFRQSIIAAGLISGHHGQMREYLLGEAEDLRLDPVDMTWVEALPG